MKRDFFKLRIGLDKEANGMENRTGKARRKPELDRLERPVQDCSRHRRLRRGMQCHHARVLRRKKISFVVFSQRGKNANGETCPCYSQ